MTKTLTRTEKKTTRRTVERSYTLYPYAGSKVVLAEVVTKDTDVKRGQPVTRWYLFSRTTYDKYQHRKAWTWILNLSKDDLFVIATTEYMKHYLDGYVCEYPNGKPKYVAESGWKEVLDTGDYGRVINDKTWYDHMMYSPEGKPIRRAFHFDYINGALGSYSYEIAKLEEWLDRQKDVKNVERIEVPHYNQDSCGTYAIEFTFQPSPRMFLRMCKEGVLTSYQTNEFVRKHLKVAKFRIPERE